MWKEFKKFAFKGNIVDMAIGVVIGTAFTGVVNSLVNNIIMPFFGFLTAGMNFEELKWVLSPAVLGEDGSVVKAEAAIQYGSFIQNAVNFLIIAFSIFFAIRIITKATERLKKKEEPKPAEPKAPTEAELLTQIRDLLKAQAPSPAEEPAEDKVQAEK